MSNYTLKNWKDAPESMTMMEARAWVKGYNEALYDMHHEMSLKYSNLIPDASDVKEAVRLDTIKNALTVIDGLRRKSYEFPNGYAWSVYTDCIVHALYAIEAMRDKK